MHSEQGSRNTLKTVIHIAFQETNISEHKAMNNIFFQDVRHDLSSCPLEIDRCRKIRPDPVNGICLT